MDIFAPLLIGIPILAGILVMLSGKSLAPYVAFTFSITELVVVFMTYMGFDPQGGFQFVSKFTWIPELGINFSFAIDGLTLLLLILTALLVSVIILFQIDNKADRPATFFGLILFMQAGLMGVFLARDGFLFYLFWELALIPVYFLAAIWGENRRIAVTLKFFVYTIFGSLFMLLSLIYLYLQTPGVTHSADIVDLYAAGRNLGAGMQGWVFWGLFIAFAIKMPIFPFHTWQPDTYTESPAAASMLLSGIMLKMGIYGVIRWLLPIAPLGLIEWGPWAITLSVIGIIYGSIIAIRQRDVKRLVAYSSFAHVGLMSAAVFSLTSSGMSGAVIQMLAHGINVVGLFIVIDIIQQRTGNRDILSLSGISQKNIALTVFFGILMLGSVALPLTNGFPGEFLMLKGVFEYNKYLGATAGLTIILGAVYMLRFFQQIMFGPAGEFTDKITPLSMGEGVALFILCFFVFWIGLIPNSFLGMVEPSLQTLLNDVQVQTGLALPEVSFIK